MTLSVEGDRNSTQAALSKKKKDGDLLTNVSGKFRDIMAKSMAGSKV